MSICIIHLNLMTFLPLKKTMKSVKSRKIPWASLQVLVYFLIFAIAVGTSYELKRLQNIGGGHILVTVSCKCYLEATGLSPIP